MKFTRLGITSINEALARLDAGRDTLKTFGSELRAFYLTMGRFRGEGRSAAPEC